MNKGDKVHDLSKMQPATGSDLGTIINIDKDVYKIEWADGGVGVRIASQIELVTHYLNKLRNRAKKHEYVIRRLNEVEKFNEADDL
jgi:hypothetical protein